MNRCPILKVAVIEDGRLGVFPADTCASYQYVYRAAAGVYWDDGASCFKSTPPHDWSYTQWYKHIHSVVRDEVGLTMVLTPSTIFEAEESGFSDDIRMADQELRG